nr:MAG TPA: hypothetical protein [Caudoviricetes sp.]
MEKDINAPPFFWDALRGVLFLWRQKGRWKL